jgi:hypothetical protein
LAGGTFGLYRLFGNRFEKLVTPFKTVSTLQGIQSDGKGHTFLATDAGLVELDSSPGTHDFAIPSFPQPPGTSGAQANGVFIDAMRSGTVAGWNSAEWMFEGLESFRETADFRPIRLWPSRKTAPEISG